MAHNTYLRFELGDLPPERIAQLQSDLRDALGDTGQFTWKSLTGSNAHLDGVATQFRTEDTNRDNVADSVLLKVQPGGGNNALTEIARHVLHTLPSAVRCNSGSVLSCTSMMVDVTTVIPDDIKQFKDHRERAAHWRSRYHVGEAVGEKLFELLLSQPEGPPAAQTITLPENPTAEDIVHTITILSRDDQGRATLLGTDEGSQLGIRWDKSGNMALYNPQTKFAMQEVTQSEFEKAQKLPHKAKAASSPAPEL